MEKIIEIITSLIVLALGVTILGLAVWVMLNVWGWIF